MIHKELFPAIGMVTYTLDKIGVSYQSVSQIEEDNKNSVQISMRQPDHHNLSVMVGTDTPQRETIFDDLVPITNPKSMYDLPIPKAAFFGTQTFSLAVAESGAITQIGYGANSGASQVLGTAENAVNSFAGQTTAERAAEAKAEADLIAQQQRLIRCIADQINCT